MSTAPDTLAEHFQQLYQQDPDPWQVRQRWYEQRKRALQLAALPQARYHSAFEPGCGNGEMSAALVRRCDFLLAADVSPRAVELARQRLCAASAPEAEAGTEASPACQFVVERLCLPDDWPAQPFDLIVLSEIGYYLQREALDAVISRCLTGLAEGGTLMLCHWRAPASDQSMSAGQVHALFDAAPGLHRLVRHEERDFLLDVWSNDGRSVAQREGLS